MSDDVGGGASRTTEPAAGSSAATDVSIREYLISIIAGDRKTNRERFVFLSLLGGVIWFFVERHLADLNHENARVAKVTESSVSADTYQANEQRRDSERSGLEEWRKDVDRDRTQGVTREEFQRDTKTDKRAGFDSGTKIVMAVIAACVLGLGILNYQALHTSKPVVVTPTVTVSK